MSESLDTSRELQPPKIGICFSGGGFRASFYALGVLRYLAEANVLAKVVSVSAVSGGSIVAAALADRADSLATASWSLTALLEQVDGPFRHVVTTRNLRNRWLGRALAARLSGRRVGRGFVLGEVLAEYLYKTRSVRDLPRGPQVILTTTDLATGRALRIARDFMGSYDFSYVEPVPASVTLGFAVAASAAVPALFPPATLATDGLGLRDAPPILSLADGGVYDNLGLEWYQGWSSGRPSSAIKPNFLIVANASGLLNRTLRPYGGLRGLWRSKAVQYNQTTKLRVRWFVGDLVGGRERGIYLGIELDPRLYVLPDGRPIDPRLYDGALASRLIAPLAGLRTDLDRFLPQEADLLSYHAYWSTHARVAALYPELAVAAPAWREFAELEPTDVEHLRRFLLNGAKRLRFPRGPV
ncbi:MAG TPA: patatin-like phospholipase family protein [Thermoanaerobaculia bacterium]